jgi:hypothetical protein
MSLRRKIYFIVVGELICIFVLVVCMLLPHDTPIEGLAMCGDRLCYFGMVPGKTTFADAKKIIESHLATSGYKPAQDIYNDLGLPDYSGSYDVIDGPIYSIDLYKNGDWLTGITLYFRDDSSLSLAKFVAYLGQPSSVTVRRTIAQWVNYPSGSLVLPVWDAPIAPYTAVDGVYLSYNDEFSGACDTVVWYGYDLLGYRLPPC